MAILLALLGILALIGGAFTIVCAVIALTLLGALLRAIFQGGPEYGP